MNKFANAVLSILLLAMLAGCASITQSDSGVSAAPTGVLASVFADPPEYGQASFYSAKYQGRITASGERFDQNAATASHRTLAFGRRVRVTNTDNGRAVVVTINDRGPFIKGRVIDLSRSAFAEIADPALGLVPVKVELLDD